MVKHAITAILTLLAVTLGAQAPKAPTPPETPSARAARVHKAAIVVDTHIDTTQMLGREGWDFTARHGHERGRGGDGSHVDLPRMREGGLDAAFFSIFMPGTVTGPEAVKRSLLMIDNVRRLTERHPNDIVLATTAAEVRAAHKAGKIAALMGMEGGHMIDDSLSVLRDYQRLGVRYMTLTHSVNTNWADSSGDKPAHNGLTDFGKDVVREMNRLGMLVDISHVADKTFWDVLDVSTAPPIASHSSSRVISGHPRNMTDEMVKALAAKGGVVQVNYEVTFLDNDRNEASNTRQGLSAEERAKLPPMPDVPWTKIIEHIDHMVKLVGPTHVGLGSDFDGATMPSGMDDVSMLPKITAALLAKGYSEKDVTNILGGNLLRVMEDVERVGRAMRTGGEGRSSGRRRSNGAGAAGRTGRAGA
jgi:membrane dipeptidase